MSYRIEDLESAKRELQDLEKRFDNYSGNNPNKYQSDIKAARRKVSEIERSLKALGVIKLTDAEEHERKLDSAFPNAKSREIVEFEGRKYMRRFVKSPDGWDRYWEPITSKE